MHKKSSLLFAAGILMLSGCSTVKGWFGSDDDGEKSDKATASATAAVDMNDPQQAADAFMQMLGRDFLPTCNPDVYFQFVAYPQGVTPERIAAGKKKLQETCQALDNREDRAQKTRALRAHGMRDADTPGAIVVHYRGPDGEEQSYPFVQTAEGWKYPFPFE